MCTIHNKQGGYKCYHIPTHQVITRPYVTVIPATPTIIVTIHTIGKSDSIQNLKITNLYGHLLFDSSMDPALLAGVDDYDKDNDEHTSLAGVYNEETSITGVPIPNTQAVTSTEDESDVEPDHDSIDPDKADDNSSKASIHSTRSDISAHSVTSEQPQPLLNEEPNDVESPELETQVPILHPLERVSAPPSNYIPQMQGKTYVMNEQTETREKDKDSGLVYNHDEARVLATVITAFNEYMEHVVEEHRQQHVVTYSLKAGINKFGN